MRNMWDWPNCLFIEKDLLFQQGGEESWKDCFLPKQQGRELTSWKLMTFLELMRELRLQGTALKYGGDKSFQRKVVLFQLHLSLKENSARNTEWIPKEWERVRSPWGLQTYLCQGSHPLEGFYSRNSEGRLETGLRRLTLWYQLKQGREWKSPREYCQTHLHHLRGTNSFICRGKGTEV